jgi:hypothetical protein
MHACGAGNSTTDHATLVFSVAPPWPTPQHMWSWQQHHGSCDAGFQRRSALADAPTHVELATAPRIMRRWFSVSLRLGRRPPHEELATSPRIMRRWFSASLRFGRRPTHVELATAPRIMRRWFSVSLRLGRRPTCGAGCVNSLLFAVLLAPLVGSILVSITLIYFCLVWCSIVIVSHMQGMHRSPVSIMSFRLSYCRLVV